MRLTFNKFFRHGFLQCGYSIDYEISDPDDGTACHNFIKLSHHVFPQGLISNGARLISDSVLQKIKIVHIFPIFYRINTSSVPESYSFWKSAMSIDS